MKTALSKVAERATTEVAFRILYVVRDTDEDLKEQKRDERVAKLVKKLLDRGLKTTVAK